MPICTGPRHSKQAKEGGVAVIFIFYYALPGHESQQVYGNEF